MLCLWLIFRAQKWLFWLVSLIVAFWGEDLWASSIWCQKLEKFPGHFVNVPSGDSDPQPELKTITPRILQALKTYIKSWHRKSFCHIEFFFKVFNIWGIINKNLILKQGLKSGWKIDLGSARLAGSLPCLYIKVGRFSPWT